MSVMSERTTAVPSGSMRTLALLGTWNCMRTAAAIP